MATVLGADSAARFSASLAKAAGYSIGARYLGFPGDYRRMTPPEVDDYARNDLILLPIYETDGTPDGYDDGARQGAAATTLLAQLGLTSYGCVFTDDVSGAPYPRVRDWMRGVTSTFGGVRIFYGPNNHGDALVDENLADAVWVEGAWSFSTGYNPRNPQPPYARHGCGVQYPNQYKIGGVTVDYNTFTGTPWLPGNTPGDDSLSAADVAAINAHTDQQIAGLQNQLGTWMQQQSANVVAALTPVVNAAGFQSRRFAFRIGGQPDAWLVSFDASGATRCHIPDQATEQALLDIGAISPVLDIDVTDGAKAAALQSIRVVPWNSMTGT